MKKVFNAWIVVFSLLLLMSFVGCGNNDGKTGGDTDTSVFPFDEAETVVFGYGYNDMSYPFDQSENLVQFYGGQAEGEENFLLTVSNGELKIETKQGVEGYNTAFFRIYSTEFDKYESGQRVKITLQVNIDPQLSPSMFLGHNDKDGKEQSNQTRIPKAGEYAQLTIDTCIETSSGYYRNNLNSGNQKNVMFGFFRIGAGESFSIDKINFSFIE